MRIDDVSSVSLDTKNINKVGLDMSSRSRKCDAPIQGCLVDHPSSCGISVSHIMRHIHE